MPAVVADEGLFSGSAGPPAPRSDAAVRARFYIEAVQDKTETKTQGRPIWKDVEFVEKRVVGDKTSIVQRPATDADRRQFPQEYALFKQGDAEQLTGTPLREWPQVSRSQVEELAYFNVRTVEQLAAVSDGNLMQIGPIRALRDRAKDWIAAAQGQAPATALRAELEDAKKVNASLQAQIDELRALVSKPSKTKQ